MPRAASKSSCWTCRRRKIKCDGLLPICARCQKRKLFCDRSSHLRVKEYTPRENKKVFAVGASPPAEDLKDNHIADLFHIYLRELAPWYDLNDNDCAFARQASVAALHSKLLFSAIIAFSAIYTARKKSSDRAIAEAYHLCCLRLLIGLSEQDDLVINGTALAATCLLRSYEILSESEDPNRHLFGASTLIPCTPSLVEHSLLSAGFWNYLREDITYSLVHECPLKLEIDRIPYITVSEHDAKANQMTLLLGRAVNQYFGDHQQDDIFGEVEEWRRNFHVGHLARFEGNSFPAVYMLRDCQVAALHYYHVAKAMLKPEDRSKCAEEICGLAITARSAPVIVNAYGPICFTGQWISDKVQQQALVQWLKQTQELTSWPVDRFISQLEDRWN